MLVSNSDLATILDIELSTANSRATEGGHHFYFRSWALRPHELRHVIEDLELEENFLPEFELWRNVLDTHHARTQPGSNAVVTLRYVGTCQSPTRPYDRYQADLRKRDSGTLHDFIKKVEQL